MYYCSTCAQRFGLVFFRDDVSIFGSPCGRDAVTAALLAIRTFRSTQKTIPAAPPLLHLGTADDRTLNVRRTLILIVMDTEQLLSRGMMTVRQQSSSLFLDLYFCLCVGTGTSFVRYHLRSWL